MQPPSSSTRPGRSARRGNHDLHVLLPFDPTSAVHEQPAPYPAEEREEYPAACEEQQHADHAVAEAVRELQHAGFASQGCMVAGLPVEAIVAKAQELNCELIIMGHRHLSRLGRLLDPSISAKVIDRVEVPVLVGAASA